VSVARLALAGALVTAALALAGCGQDSEADDRPGAQLDRPVVEPTIIRTPVRVDEAPATVPFPGGGSETQHGDDD
jgi:hypothetical protein